MVIIVIFFVLLFRFVEFVRRDSCNEKRLAQVKSTKAL